MSVSAPFTATLPTPIFRFVSVDYYYTYIFPLETDNLSAHIFSTIIPMVIYTQCFSVCQVQFFHPYTLHNFSCDLHQSIFRVCILCVIFPRHLTTSFYMICAMLAYWFSVLVCAVCNFSIMLVIYSALWYAPDALGLTVDYSLYQFSAHATNPESLIKRFIFPFNGIFSVLPISTSTMRLSSDTRHFSS